VSAAYAVSVVLIETKAPVVAPLPVLTRNLQVRPFTEPTIESVDPQIITLSAGVLTIAGFNLVGRDTVVIFDGNPSSPQTPTTIGDGATVKVSLPALPAGINTLRIVRQIDLGVIPKTRFVESNVASFILQPVIRRDPVAPHDYLIQVGTPDTTFTPPRVPVTVTLDPAIAATQKISLLLNELSPPAGIAPRSYMFDAAAADLTPPDKALIYTQGVATGDYLARIRVDGADSSLDIDPVSKAFVTPRVKF
jgi:hypothetical protein